MPLAPSKPLSRPSVAEIDARLAELAQENNEFCLSCGYRLYAPDQGICTCCYIRCWPPFNEFFRCEFQDRIAWIAVQVGLGRVREDQEIPPFPGDRSPMPEGVARRGKGLFDALRQVDLVTWVGQFTELRQTGQGRWKGLCPIHQEKTPSFHIFQGERGWSWRCFGACASGGDIVALARELKQVGKR